MSLLLGTKEKGGFKSTFLRRLYEEISVSQRLERIILTSWLDTSNAQKNYFSCFNLECSSRIVHCLIGCSMEQ